MMSRLQGWLVGLAVLGGTAAMAAGVLFWMLVTRPVDLARVLAGGW